MNREQFIEGRTAYHKVILNAQNAGTGIPDHAIDFWAKAEAEKDWMRTRVYDHPVEVSAGNVWTHDRHVPGAKLSFNPDGPMVSVMSLSFEELRELMVSGIKFLRAKGEWPSSDEVRALFHDA